MTWVFTAAAQAGDGATGARDGFLRFENLTPVPIQTKLVDASLLSGDELTWLNEYVCRVCAVHRSWRSTPAVLWLMAWACPSYTSPDACVAITVCGCNHAAVANSYNAWCRETVSATLACTDNIVERYDCVVAAAHSRSLCACLRRCCHRWRPS